MCTIETNGPINLTTGRIAEGPIFRGEKLLWRRLVESNAVGCSSCADAVIEFFCCVHRSSDSSCFSVGRTTPKYLGSRCCGVRSKKINSSISATDAAYCIAPNWPESHWLFSSKNSPCDAAFRLNYLTTCFPFGRWRWLHVSFSTAR